MTRKTDEELMEQFNIAFDVNQFSNQQINAITEIWGKLGFYKGQLEYFEMKQKQKEE